MLADALGYYRERGWPVIPVRPRSKIPLTKHGVKDATTDTAQIAAWWKVHPDANVGIACGAPGPQVLDIDDLAAVPAEELARLDALHTFAVATARGRHYYATGTADGTVTLASGELRGAGGYVVAPPSQHESGTYYTVLDTGAGGLASVAELGVPARTSGYFDPAPDGLVPLGGRHNFLYKSAEDAMLRGITDRAELLALVQARFESRCEPEPPPRPDEFTGIVDWAMRSRIAADVRATGPKRGAGKRAPIAHDAPRAELFGRIHQAMGLPAEVRITEVRRFGPNNDDALHIHLSLGEPVIFDHQADVTTPRLWATTVIFGCNGIAQPPPLKQADLIGVAFALTAVARAVTQAEREADLAELVTDLAALAETITGDLEKPAARYELLGELTARPLHEPRDGMMAKAPTLIVDRHTGRRYLRAHELMALARHHGFRFRHGAFRGLMAQVGVTWRRVQAHGEAGHRNHVLYELPEEA